MYPGDREQALRAELQRAAADHAVVRIVYSGGSSPYRPREIEIYDVDETYCRAFCLLREEPRTFRLDRIVEVAITEEHFSMRPRAELRWSLPTRPYRYGRSRRYAGSGSQGCGTWLIGGLILGLVALRGCAG